MLYDLGADVFNNIVEFFSVANADPQGKSIPWTGAHILQVIVKPLNYVSYIVNNALTVVNCCLNFYINLLLSFQTNQN